MEHKLNPEFYYKQTRADAVDKTTVVLSPAYGNENNEFGWHRLINQSRAYHKTSSTTKKTTFWNKIASPKAVKLIENRAKIEKIISKFLKEHIGEAELSQVQSKLKTTFEDNLKFKSVEDLNHISTSSSLFFSGSALTNIILDYFNKTKTAKNFKDIDIYIFMRDIHNIEVNHKKKIIPSNYLENSFFKFHSDVFNKLNLVWTYPRERSFTRMTPETLFEEFDLSCNHIYFNIQTKSLHWSPFFIEFLETHLIRLNPSQNSLGTRSLIRAHKKSLEFNAKVAWDEAEIPLILNYLEYNGLSSTSGGVNHIRDDHKLWFKSNKIPLINKVPRSSKIQLDEKLNVFAFLLENENKSKKEFIIKYFNLMRNENILGSGKLPKNFFKSLADTMKLLPMILLTDQFMNDFSTIGYKARQEPYKDNVVWHEHTQLKYDIWESGGYSLIYLNSWIKKFMSFVEKPEFQPLKLRWIGFIESQPGDLKLSELPGLWDTFLLHQENDKKPLAKPIDMGKWNNQIIELVSQVQLNTEGDLMKHCVAGYGSAISRGYCRIFHIENIHGVSTVQIDIANEKIIQHHSMNNRNAPGKHKVLVNRFLKYLKTLAA